MDRTSQAILGILVLTIVLLLLFIVRTKKKIKKESENIFVKEKSGKKNNLVFLYRFYEHVPFFSRYFTKVKSGVEIIYPADSISINKKVSSILLKGTGIGILGIVITLLLANGDIYFILAGFALTYLIVDKTFTNTLEKMSEQLLVQFGDFLTQLRHNYHDVPIVETALYNTMDTLPYEIRLHAQRIYEILVSPNMKQEVDKYVGTEPNKYVLMFLSLCTSIKEFGDKKLDNGQSLFLADIGYLKEEVNSEIIGIRKNKSAFKSIPMITLAPLVAVKPLEAWATANLDEISSFYKGTYGVVAICVIFVVSFVIHYLVTSLRDGDSEKEVNDSIFARLANNKLFSPFLTKIINKNYTKYRRYDSQLRGMGDHTGAKAFLFKRITFAVVAFTVTVVVLFTSSLTSRYAKLHDWTDDFKDSVVPTEEYREIMQETGMDYTLALKGMNISDLDQTELENDIKKNTSITSDTYASQVASSVITHLTKYHNTYFKWFELLIALGLAGVAYYAPVFYLKWKRQAIEMRKEEEVVRFQSLMLILMHINGTTLPVILEWLERFSYCFKESITMCRVNISNGTKEALQELKDSEDFQPFKDFVDNLLSIDKVGVEKAFDEVQTDREYYLAKREEDREESIISKSSKARLVMYIPFFATLGLYVIVPMVMYVINMMSTMTEIFG